MTRRKIAVLGGGMGALSAVWELSRDPSADITVYQMGWRLGGKCASGRNRAHGNRIEEHGLHVLGGFYDHTFRLIREVYGALPDQRPWTEAFTKRSRIIIGDWTIDAPENELVPGDATELPSPREYALRLGSWIKAQARAPRGMSPARLAMLIDLGRTILRGLVTDRVFTRGFEAIDGEDWRAWLARHGARRTSIDSPLVRGIYDYVFAYEGGDRNRPQLAAGTATHGVLRLLLTYRGAIFYEMNGGMGDVVFAPLYRALVARGVRFEFFHRVSSLRTAGEAIDRVELVRQARARNPYEPLVRVKGELCWPSTPLWEQLEGGERNVDFETSLDGEPLALERGRDFDEVILGIPAGVLPKIAGELIAHDDRFARMVRALKTVATEATQEWSDRPRPAGPRRIATGGDPIASWADMDHLLPLEDVEGARSLTYTCGAHHEARPRQKPIPNDPRLYARVNVEPSERYVMSVPGSSEHRLRPGESRFANLVLAGDWVKTAINAGCVEAATMSGVEAAKVVRERASRKRRVAILGGGAGAMTAAWYLSENPDLEVTVYQMGWRLGGKGASGRNTKAHDRVEEHGLHVWGGFYHNAFRLVQDAYASAARTTGPLRSWTDAFHPAPRVVWKDRARDRWSSWILDTPENRGTPGHPRGVLPDPAILIGWARHLATQCRDEGLVGFQRGRVLADLLATIVRGIIADGLLVRGFMSVDGEDFAAWLERHGAATTTIDSTPVRAFYDYFFAFENGDPARPRISAGIALNHLLKLMFHYEGALFWKMAGGMGDIVFAPLYEACRARGVRFRFFHEVVGLEPSEDGRSIAAVDIKRQIDLAPDREEYAPLIDAGGVPSWPSEPLLDQLDPRRTEELIRLEINLEDPRSGWEPAAQIRLRAGEDFDAIVLGIPAGALRSLTQKLARVRPEWKTMLDHLPTIQTIAMQLWFRSDQHTLGDVTGTAFADPLQSWSDMTRSLARENWPRELAPAHLTYFCGPMKTPDEPSDGATELARAHVEKSEWCTNNLAELFPRANGDSIVAEYVRANHTPSDRYVLDLPGSSQHRLEADTSGFDNLALAGDWLFTGLGGSVESAVITGMQAARALSGRPLEITGEMKSPWRRAQSLKSFFESR